MGVNSAKLGTFGRLTSDRTYVRNNDFASQVLARDGFKINFSQSQGVADPTKDLGPEKKGLGEEFNRNF